MLRQVPDSLSVFAGRIFANLILLKLKIRAKDKLMLCRLSSEYADDR
jgi:hypothetical protein